MNTIRLITLALPLMFLMACGGGGGGKAAAPTTMTPPPNPLTQFSPTTGSRSIQDLQAITSVTGTDLSVSSVAEEGNFGSEESVRRATNTTSIVTLPSSTSSITMNTGGLDDISLMANSSYTSSYTSMTTNGVTVGDDVTLARGRIAATRASDSSPLGFETFAGWLDSSAFGTTQITIGASGSEEYRFVSYAVGVYDASNAANPTATGSETTSATWEGSAVASIKEDRTFILGDAEITVNFTDANVDLMFDNWRDLENQNLTSMQPITYEDLTLTSGAFEGSGNEQVQGRFYGDGHAEVGGFFNTMEVTGAFGGTRQ